MEVELIVPVGRGDSTWGDAFSLGEAEAGEWLGCVQPGTGHKELSPPAWPAWWLSPAVPRDALASPAAFFAKSLTMRFPHALLTPSKASFASSLSVTWALSGSCKAEQARCIPAHHSVSVEPLMGSGSVEGRSRQDGRGSNPPFPLAALTPGQCFPQKLCGLPWPFSLLVHLCFLCHNP